MLSKNCSFASRSLPILIPWSLNIMLFQKLVIAYWQMLLQGKFAPPSQEFARISKIYSGTLPSKTLLWNLKWLRHLNTFLHFPADLCKFREWLRISIEFFKSILSLKPRWPDKQRTLAQLILEVHIKMHSAIKWGTRIIGCLFQLPCVSNLVVLHIRRYSPEGKISLHVRVCNSFIAFILVVHLTDQYDKCMLGISSLCIKEKNDSGILSNVIAWIERNCGASWYVNSLKGLTENASH